MNVEQMISRASLLGVGLDQPSKADVRVYLEYLNLAHFELYNLFSSLNPAAYWKYVDTTLDENTVKNPLFVASVHLKDGRNVLKKGFFEDVIQADPFLERTGTPACWYTQETTPLSWNVFLYPRPSEEASSVHMRIYYVLQPVELTLDTEEKDIPYPPADHSLLVDGLIYYMVQGDEGFNSSVDVKLYLQRWETKKSMMLARYQMTKRRPISTFCEA